MPLVASLRIPSRLSRLELLARRKPLSTDHDCVLRHAITIAQTHRGGPREARPRKRVEATRPQAPPREDPGSDHPDRGLHRGRHRTVIAVIVVIAPRTPHGARARSSLRARLRPQRPRATRRGRCTGRRVRSCTRCRRSSLSTPSSVSLRRPCAHDIRAASCSGCVPSARSSCRWSHLRAASDLGSPAIKGR